MPSAKRLLNHPIITPKTHPSIGRNIQGPSLIQVPDWVVNPLGSYYLYFADHKGSYIRLAYANELTGHGSSMNQAASIFVILCSQQTLRWLHVKQQQILK